jgi:general stress protein YciG
MVLAMNNEVGRKMTRQEAGRRGGEKVAKERGPEFYREIGRKGGEKVAEERGSEFYREIGRKGGESRSNRIGTNIISIQAGRLPVQLRTKRAKLDS